MGKALSDRDPFISCDYKKNIRPYSAMSKKESWKSGFLEIERANIISKIKNKSSTSLPKRWLTEEYFRIPVIESPKNIYLSIRGIDFSLPISLNNIAKSIEDSQVILDMNDDWDEDGAAATDISTFNKAISFLTNYSKFILEKYKIKIHSPYIDITRDGSVTVLWEIKKTKFLIIFKKNDSPYAYYYAQEVKNSIVIPFNHAVENSKNIDETTALWMSKNLS